MIDAVLLGLGLWLAATLSLTAVPSLTAPLCYAPLMLAAGLIVLHRRGPLLGVLWLLVGALVLRDLALLVAAPVGAVLASRVFAARSVYSLVGLGVTTGAAVLLAQLLGSAWLSLSGRGSMGVAAIVWRYVLLLALLYAGYLFVHVARRALSHVFVIRRHEH